MSLPILQHHEGLSSADLVRLFHQTEARWTQHIAHEHPLDVGTAYNNPKLDRVYDANNIRDVALPEGLTPAQAFELVNEHYAARGTQCTYWVMNPAVDASLTQPMADYLAGQGYQRRTADILLLRRPAVMVETPGLTIIPARASFRHAQELAEEAAARWNEPQLADASMLHLDDPHWDMLLALKDGKAVAEAGVLAVGEVGRIDDVFVSPGHRRQGIGRTMLARVLEICARAQLRHVMLSVLSDNEPAQRLYRSAGFEKIGEVAGHFAPGLKLEP